MMSSFFKISRLNFHFGSPMFLKKYKYGIAFQKAPERNWRTSAKGRSNSILINLPKQMPKISAIVSGYKSMRHNKILRVMKTKMSAIEL